MGLKQLFFRKYIHGDEITEVKCKREVRVSLFLYFYSLCSAIVFP